MSEPIANRDKSIAISKSIETGARHPWSYLDSRRYMQHNVNLPDGMSGILQFVDGLPDSSSKVTALRAFEDGDISFTHLEYYLEPYGHTAGFEVHRWEDGRVVEHWDNLQAVPDDVNVSGRSMFDGSAEIRDVELTESNKARAAEFITAVLADVDETHVEQYVAQDYISHRPDYGDGVAEVRRALRDARAGGLRHRTLRRVLGEGNFVLTMTEGSRGEEDVAIFDLLRLSDGKVAEHWDVVETIPPQTEWKNTNGKF